MTLADPEARVRAVVLELWPRAEAGEAFATDLLQSAFKRHKALDHEARGAIAERFYSLLRQRRRLLFALEGAGVRVERGALALYLSERLLAGALTPREARREYPGLDWHAVAEVDARIAAEVDPARRFALTHSFPDDLAAALLEDYGEEALALGAALNASAPVTLRANLAKNTRNELKAMLEGVGVETKPTPFSSSGLLLSEHHNVYRLPAFAEGRFEVQDEGSQLIAELVAPPPGGLVIDGCAGAGGKTLALASLLGGKGKVVAAEPSPKKLQELSRRMRRAGASNVEPVQLDANFWPEALRRLEGRADRVLLDVPCSGFGALRRNPELRWRRPLAELAALQRLQGELLSRYAPLVRSGGRLVYATCTVLRSENHAQIEGFLSTHPDYELVRAAEIWGRAKAEPLTDPTGTFLELFPHRQGTDGFFAAVLRRRRLTK